MYDRVVTDSPFAWYSVARVTLPHSVSSLDLPSIICDNFLYGFKGAPSARRAYGRNRLRELARATGESRAAG
jgi:hypothetical protein